MKFSIIVLFVCLSLLAQSKETSAPPAGVPAGAVSADGHTWRWVDKDGKAWLYRATPFGMMRNEEPKPSATPKTAAVPPKDAKPDAVLDLMSVKEEGDSLRFSRPGPFGTYSWVKKKTQLDKDETAVWERAQSRSVSTKKD